jgi:large subunit ribosomal protein L15
MPLQRRVPKFGFTNHNRVAYQSVNLDIIQELASKLNTDSIDFDVLHQNGLVSKKDLVKVLGRGELTSKLNVSAHSFSASAIAAIEKVGGSVNKI